MAYSERDTFCLFHKFVTFARMHSCPCPHVMSAWQGTRSGQMVRCITCATGMSQEGQDRRPEDSLAGLPSLCHSSSFCTESQLNHPMEFYLHQPVGPLNSIQYPAWQMSSSAGSWLEL